MQIIYIYTHDLCVSEIEVSQVMAMLVVKIHENSNH